MAMTQRELESLLWRATILCLGLDPDSQSQSVQKRVRISWPKTAGSWSQEENVVFLRVSPANTDEFGALRDIGHTYDSTADTLKETVTYHRCYNVMWVCYGPESDADADAVRIGLLSQPVHELLIGNNVGIKPHIAEPVRLPEQDESGDWWERCDLSAEAYVLNTREYTEGMIATAPSIDIQ